MLEMDIESTADIHDCLASNIKTKAHAAMIEVLKLFTGRFFYFIAESRSVGSGDGAYAVIADRPVSIDIRRSLMLKANDLVLLTRRDGDILGPILGFGLFYRDTCYGMRK